MVFETLKPAGHGAAKGGTVAFAGDYGAYGNAVIINHADGFSTLSGHGEMLYVSKGQTVIAQQLIMGAGSTGGSTGVHLHYSVIRTSTIDFSGQLPSIPKSGFINPMKPW